jgi:hypothetical protein
MNNIRKIILITILAFILITISPAIADNDRVFNQTNITNDTDNNTDNGTVIENNTNVTEDNTTNITCNSTENSTNNTTVENNTNCNFTNSVTNTNNTNYTDCVDNGTNNTNGTFVINDAYFEYGVPMQKTGSLLSLLFLVLGVLCFVVRYKY